MGEESIFQQQGRRDVRVGKGRACTMRVAEVHAGVRQCEGSRRGVRGAAPRISCAAV